MATTEMGMRTEEILRELEAQERTVAWLSRKVGVSVSHLHRVLVTRERALGPALAKRIAEEIGVAGREVGA